MSTEGNLAVSIKIKDALKKKDYQATNTEILGEAWLPEVNTFRPPVSAEVSSVPRGLPTPAVKLRLHPHHRDMPVIHYCAHSGKPEASRP